MLVDPEEIRDQREQAHPLATVTALDSARTRHLAMDARLDCHLCDDDGYRTNNLVCDHIDRTHTHRAGMNAVRAALRTPQSPDEQEPHMQPENPAALNSAAGTRGSE